MDSILMLLFICTATVNIDKASAGEAKILHNQYINVYSPLTNPFAKAGDFGPVASHVNGGEDGGGGGKGGGGEGGGGAEGAAPVEDPEPNFLGKHGFDAMKAMSEMNNHIPHPRTKRAAGPSPAIPLDPREAAHPGARLSPEEAAHPAANLPLDHPALAEALAYPGSPSNGPAGVNIPGIVSVGPGKPGELGRSVNIPGTISINQPSNQNTGPGAPGNRPAGTLLRSVGAGQPAPASNVQSNIANFTPTPLPVKVADQNPVAGSADTQVPPSTSPETPLETATSDPLAPRAANTQIVANADSANTVTQDPLAVKQNSPLPSTAEPTPSPIALPINGPLGLRNVMPQAVPSDAFGNIDLHFPKHPATPGPPSPVAPLGSANPAASAPVSAVEASKPTVAYVPSAPAAVDADVPVLAMTAPEVAPSTGEESIPSISGLEIPAEPSTGLSAAPAFGVGEALLPAMPAQPDIEPEPAQPAAGNSDLQSVAGLVSRKVSLEAAIKMAEYQLKQRQFDLARKALEFKELQQNSQREKYLSLVKLLATLSAPVQ